MPNHVTQRITLVGPKAAVEHFRRCHFTNGQESDVLEQIEATRQNRAALEALAAKDRAELDDYEQKRVKWWSEYGNASSLGHLTDLEQQLAEIRSGALGRNFDLHTFAPRPPFLFSGGLTMEQERANNRNWYAFNVSRFGTKWNAYDCDIDQEVEELGDGQARLVFRYDTAWSPCSPIISMIAEAYPDLRMTHEYIDEGWCFWGVASAEHGVLDDLCFDKLDDDYARRLLLWLLRNLLNYDDDRFAEMIEGSKDFIGLDPKLVGRETLSDLLPLLA